MAQWILLNLLLNYLHAFFRIKKEKGTVNKHCVRHFDCFCKCFCLEGMMGPTFISFHSLQIFDLKLDFISTSPRNFFVG